MNLNANLGLLLLGIWFMLAAIYIELTRILRAIETAHRTARDTTKATG
jgi:hypothetical protein